MANTSAEQTRGLTPRQYQDYVKENLKNNPDSGSVTSDEITYCKRHNGGIAIGLCPCLRPTEWRGHPTNANTTAGFCVIMERIDTLLESLKEVKNPNDLRRRLPGRHSLFSGITIVRCPRGIIAPSENSGYILINSQRKKYITISETTKD